MAADEHPIGMPALRGGLSARIAARIEKGEHVFIACGIEIGAHDIERRAEQKLRPFIHAA